MSEKKALINDKVTLMDQLSDKDREIQELKEKIEYLQLTVDTLKNRSKQHSDLASLPNLKIAENESCKNISGKAISIGNMEKSEINSKNDEEEPFNFDIDEDNSFSVEEYKAISPRKKHAKRSTESLKQKSDINTAARNLKIIIPPHLPLASIMRQHEVKSDQKIPDTPNLNAPKKSLRLRSRLKKSMTLFTKVSDIDEDQRRNFKRDIGPLVIKMQKLASSNQNIDKLEKEEDTLSEVIGMSPMNQKPREVSTKIKESVSRIIYYLLITIIDEDCS